MSDVKQVKVDNWGIYFLQRLKHFFNRTDYCDLTLQFQDNAQLKVHRLVLNACTEYFEILERTCEMYEDCLVMPDDLQADVVVPIVNFMYTGQLEFRMEALDKLYQTSQVMNMPVLSKLLEAHRSNNTKRGPYAERQPKLSKPHETSKHSHAPSFTPSSAKRSYTKAFENNKFVTKSLDVNKMQTTKTLQAKRNISANDSNVVYRDKKYHEPLNKQTKKSQRIPSPIPLDSALYNKKLVLGDPRPTRYELPEELDTDNVFDNSSFSNISYTTKPLMVHPETTKQYSAKKSNHLFNEPTSSKKGYANSTVDIVECKKISNKNDNIYDEDVSQSQSIPFDDIYSTAYLSVKEDSRKDTNQLFDQILDNNEGPKVTIEAKDNKTAGALDHAKIISEVLKRYPHLVKSNKNIKLKILNNPAKKKVRPITLVTEDKEVKQEVSYTYETDVLDSKEAAKLIAMGAENIKGPWICLICGTPGRALNFTSYYNFRRHLVEVHQEKPVSTICEYCGLKSHKRNYLLHHIYTKHGVPPPPHYHFPKCNLCDYIALTEGFLVKHKLSHSEERRVNRCSVCFASFTSTNHFIWHIQKSGHNQNNSDKKINMQCNYCMKVFIRDNNYFAHLKTAHKEQAIKDGIVEDSDEEREDREKTEEKRKEIKPDIKYELPVEQDFDDVQMQYQIHKRPDSNVHAAKKPKLSNSSQKILNPGYSTPFVANQSQKVNIISEDNEFLHEDESSAVHENNIVVINDNEYIMKDNQLIPRKPSMKSNEYIISDFIEEEPEHRLPSLETVTPTTSMEFTDIHPSELLQQQQQKMVLKKSANINQPIQIVVSNEEEYKALMASNHSIIFDDSDPNKTLTVLTAAQNPQLNTTGIDLENNQPNDMMIIQDDYPLNVSEAVSADNSKYVVVYSHAMEHDDPNKQYQIITSQDLGAQYVQTSAVITQNFETLTTTAPVISANVIDAQIEETWPQNDQHNTETQAHIQVTSESELQNINAAEPSNMTQVDISSSLADLPVVELTNSVVESAHTAEKTDRDETSHLMPETLPTLISEPVQVIEENQLNNTTESMEVEPTEMPVESTVEKLGLTEGINPEQEMVVQNNTETVNMDTSQEQQPDVSVSAEDQSNDEIIEESNSVPETDNTDSVEPALNIVEDVSTSDENTVTEEIPANSENIVPVVEAKKQIQSLTSEWSDEYDTILEQPMVPDAPKHISDAENIITEEPELEESIENIKYEVQKPIDNTNEMVATERETSPEKLQSNVDEISEPQPVIPTVNVEATQEKISSLLNDWEDNDSQEETLPNDNNDSEIKTNEPAEVNGTDASTAVDIIKTNTSSLKPLTQEDPKKDDKIKSLVSDWDDDDEENKE